MWDISLRKDSYNSAEKICEEIIAKIFYINNKKNHPTNQESQDISKKRLNTKKT